MASPVDQFKLKTLVPFEVGGVDLAYTTSSLWMTITVVAVTLFLTLSMRGGRLVPGRWQSLAELSYEFIANMIRENVGTEGRKYFPFIFTLFMFILMGNLLGMIPYSYTFTSQIVVTFAIAITIFLGVTVIGIVLHGFHFFTLFVPPGMPIVLAPLLIPIEVISYFVRPVSSISQAFCKYDGRAHYDEGFCGFHGCTWCFRHRSNLTLGGVNWF